jgi:hypothetical protein
MKLGLFDHMQKNDKPERSHTNLYAKHVEVLEFADEAGMDFYFVAEHHFDLGFAECASPGTIIGAASHAPKIFVWVRWFMSCLCGPASCRRTGRHAGQLDPGAAWSAGSVPGLGRSRFPLMASHGMKSEK